LPRRLAIPLSLIALTLAVFWPVLGFDFQLYDDGINVYNNWRVTRFSDANLLYFWQSSYDSLYIPVTYNLWALLARLEALFSPAQGLDPLLFHAANLLLHSANVLLVFVILRSLKVAGWAAWGGALFFALHPVQVAPVAWVTGMKDLLSGFFSLLAIWQYIIHAEAAGDEGKRKKVSYFLTALFLLLAMLAKPSAAATPLLLLIIGRLLLGRTWRQLGREILPLMALTAPVVIMTKLAQPGFHQVWQPDLWQRLLVSGYALCFYLAKVVLPYKLTPDYGKTPQVVLASGPWLYLTIILPSACLGVIWRKGRRWLAPTLIFMVALLPVSGLVPFDFQQISTVADRYLYLAMLGPALAVGWGLARFGRKRVWLIFLTVICILAAKAAAQVWIWESSTTLSTHAVQVNPKSWVAHNNLGIVKAEHALDAEAMAEFAASLAVNPNYADAHNNLGALYHRLNRNQEAEHHLQKALDLNPASYKSAFHLADLHSDQGAYEEAIDYYRQAIAAKPDFVEAYNNLGLILIKLKRPAEARELYLQAVAACPTHPMLYFNLARAEAELGNLRGSSSFLLKAIVADPEFAPAYHQLAHAFRDLGDEEAALRYEAQARALGFSE